MSDNDLSIGEIGRSLARIEGRLDRFFDDHESRLRGLEKWKYAVPPTLIIAGSSLTAVVLKG